MAKAEKHTLKLEIEKPQYITVNDVTYAQVDSWFGHCRRDLKLDIIYPEAQDGRTYPCILWICGGAWLMMDKSAHNLYLSRLASGGFVVASVEYRTSNQGPYPMPLQDVKAAIRYLKAHATGSVSTKSRWELWENPLEDILHVWLRWIMIRPWM